MAADYDTHEIKEYVTDRLNMIPGFRVEYFEIVDEMTMQPVTSRKEMSPDRNYYGCIAVYAGEVRLIDNIAITLR